jgi:hypothetical protein
MGALVVTDNAASMLASTITALAGVTSITLSDASKFPVVNQGGPGTDWSYVTLYDASNNAENVKVTRRDSGSNTLTIVRGTAAGISGTTDASCRAWASTTTGVACRLIAQTVNDAFSQPVTTAAAAAASASAAATSASSAATSASSAAASAAASIPNTQKAAVSGVASLDAGGFVVQLATPKDTSVTTVKIADANVTTAKIADANVTTAKIADANVTTVKIADAAITLAKLADKPVFITDRQCIISGGVDSSGLSAFGGSIGSTTVTQTGTLVATAASGFNSYGSVDRVGSITNASWTGLSTPYVTYYLYLDVAADGTCTTGSTTLAPVYQYGSSYSNTNNQFTFSISEMKGKVGTGSGANQVWRVFVGEAVTTGSVVNTITWYTVGTRYFVPYNVFPANYSIASFTHNLGFFSDSSPLKVTPYLKLINAALEAQGGTDGQVYTGIGFALNATSPFPCTQNAKNIFYRAYTPQQISYQRYSDGYIIGVQQSAAWNIGFLVERSW